MSYEIKRMWINQPSTNQEQHGRHGEHVLAHREPNIPGTYRVYLLEGDLVSFQLNGRCLSDGWPGARLELCECGNCGIICGIELLKPLAECESLGERLDAGSLVPAGECRQCGAFSYLTRKEL